jgi:hypothetical protein
MQLSHPPVLMRKHTGCDPPYGGQTRCNQEPRDALWIGQGSSGIPVVDKRVIPHQKEQKSFSAFYRLQKMLLLERMAL